MTCTHRDVTRKKPWHQLRKVTSVERRDTGYGRDKRAVTPVGRRDTGWGTWHLVKNVTREQTRDTSWETWHRVRDIKWFTWQGDRVSETRRGVSVLTGRVWNTSTLYVSLAILNNLDDVTRSWRHTFYTCLHSVFARKLKLSLTVIWIISHVQYWENYGFVRIFTVFC